MNCAKERESAMNERLSIPAALNSVLCAHPSRPYPLNSLSLLHSIVCRVHIPGHPYPLNSLSPYPLDSLSLLHSTVCHVPMATLIPIPASPYLLIPLTPYPCCTQ